MNAAFDVGADDGFHGILFAFFNPKISVFAFEPNSSTDFNTDTRLFGNCEHHKGHAYVQ